MIKNIIPKKKDPCDPDGTEIVLLTNHPNPGSFDLAGIADKAQLLYSSPDPRDVNVKVRLYSYGRSVFFTCTLDILIPVNLVTWSDECITSFMWKLLHICMKAHATTQPPDSYDKMKIEELFNTRLAEIKKWLTAKRDTIQAFLYPSHNNTRAIGFER